ncbi:ATPase family associated with various cellular activities (AAA) domain-containing protein [Ditylenchus destructor]|uniref:Origin recognition complex subunit 1 n=1 Tax=Ditylenchus destructor TaxID=166010 RepID=A0AAD4R6M1_9BILA|nr:ATPase family associated with various cellular activities (AAA) domain-containing protein [Ditylenchus destructor]
MYGIVALCVVLTLCLMNQHDACEYNGKTYQDGEEFPGFYETEFIMRCTHTGKGWRVRGVFCLDQSGNRVPLNSVGENVASGRKWLCEMPDGMIIRSTNPMADMLKKLQSVCQEVESIAQSVCILDDSMDLTLEVNETDTSKPTMVDFNNQDEEPSPCKEKRPRKAPVIFDAKKEQKKLCRTRSLSVVPNCNKPSISQHSARNSTMVDFNFDDESEDEELSQGKQMKKSRSSVNSLEFTQVAVNSKSPEQSQDLQNQDPMVDMPKELKILSLEEAESVAQSVYVLDESVETTLAENETDVNSLEFAQVAVISKSQEQIESLQIQDPFAKIPKELRTLSTSKPTMVDFDAKKEQKKLCRTRSLSVVPNCNKPSILQHSLGFAQVPVISKSPEKILDHKIQDPIADVPKGLKTLRPEEIESIAQSVYVLDDSMELTLAENESGSPPSVMGKRKPKNLKRSSSIASGSKSPARSKLNQTLPAQSPKSTVDVEPRRSSRTSIGVTKYDASGVSSPPSNNFSARKTTMVDFNNQDEEPSPCKEKSDSKPTMVDFDFDDESEYEERSPAKRKGKQIKKSPSSAKRNLFGNQDENEAGEHDDIDMDTSDPIESLSTLEQVMLKLHTSEVPEKLISRVQECKYISGVPGTGKTASVLKVVGELQQKMKEKKVEKFTFININGLELSDPKKLFCLVYSRLQPKNKKRVAAGTAQQKLNEMFSCADRRRLPLVLLVDELDMLLTTRQEVVYTVFNWAATCESRVNVIAISNTLDLPERTLSARVSSRLGDNRLCFQPYNVKQITDIIEYRISNCEAIGKDAIVFGARKVAALSGDLRKALDLIRRAIEIALEECEEKGEDPNNAKLTFQHVHKAIADSTECVRMDMCRAFSQQEEALFRAAVRELEKSGLEDMIFYRLLDEYLSVCFNMGIKPMSSSAVYSMLLDMACAHFFIVKTDANGGEMNRKLELGFSLPEAVFCLRQMDLRKNNANVS